MHTEHSMHSTSKGSMTPHRINMHAQLLGFHASSSVDHFWHNSRCVMLPPVLIISGTTAGAQCGKGLIHLQDCKASSSAKMAILVQLV